MYTWYMHSMLPGVALIVKFDYLLGRKTHIDRWINRIYHYTPEGTRESHRSVHDLQSMTRFAESWMLQIMDTGFPCPFRSVVIDYISLTLLFSINNPILMLF